MYPYKSEELPRLGLFSPKCSISEHLNLFTFFSFKISTMPMEQAVINGDIMNHSGDGLDSFLFTSESVGEGHPGKLSKSSHFYTFASRKCKQ